MITFILSLIALVLGYVLYGALVERVFGIDEHRATPALSKTDGVDYVPMSGWRIFLVQFLNIAGLGPIFGAIMGIFFGPAAFLWIVFGTIFAGGVHDYLSGMMSVRKGGVSLPDIIGEELGSGVKLFMRILSLVLLILLTTTFLSITVADIRQQYYATGLGTDYLCLLCVCHHSAGGQTHRSLLPAFWCRTAFYGLRYYGSYAWLAQRRDARTDRRFA